MNQLQKHKPVYIDQPYDRYEDEIDLVDLWLVFIRYKKVFLITFAACLALGLIYALLMPKSYNFTTSIEIGTRLQKEEIISIEDPQTVLAKIQESYVPLVLNEYHRTNPVTDYSSKITARIPKGSEIIVLETRGTENGAPTHLELQKNVVEKVRQDHQRIIGIIRKEVEIERNTAINNLNESKDHAQLIKAREQRVNGLEMLLKQQLEAAKTYLSKAEKSRQRAVREATNEARAMTLLLIDADIEKQRDRLAEIQERLRVEVADKKDTFAKQLTDNQREQAGQMDQISRLETRLVNLRETRALVPPMQSNEPVGISRTMILVLAAVLGVMLGVFAAFFAGFLAKAREKVQQQSQKPLAIHRHK